jgi:predicted ribosome quality control (RQC) complex YloA/Tae2 family protein
MKSLSSIELHHMIGELKALEGSRVDNIYQKGKEEFIFQLFKSNEGKKLLRAIVGKSIFLTLLKEDMESDSGFCMLLRKHLEGSFLEKIEQIEPERIARMAFRAKEKTFHLYIELFGKGNVILCDEGAIIIDSLHHLEFKDRKVGPKSPYKHPTQQYNLFSIDKEFLASALASSTRDSLVKCLAIDLGMGGMYAEEACLAAGIDKSVKSNELSLSQQGALLKSILGIINHPLEPLIILESGEIEDVLSYPLHSLSSHEHKSFPSFSEAVDYYMQHASPDISTSHDAKVESLKKIIEQQEKNIIVLEQEEGEQRAKAEALYSNYVQLDALLKELKAISQKHSWQDIREKLSGHALIKDVNPKEKTISIELP